MFSKIIKRSWVGKASVSLLSFLLIFLMSSCNGEQETHVDIPPTSSSIVPTKTEIIIPQDRVNPTMTTAADFQVTTEPALTTVVHDVIVWHGLDDQGALALKHIADNYQETRPQVQILLDYVPFDDLKERFLRDTEAGKGPDILLGAGEWGPSLYDKDMLMPLPEILMTEIRENLSPPALRAAYYYDIAMTLPFSIYGIVMYRNTSIMPEAPETFEELVTYAQRITKGRTIGAYLERGDLYAFSQLTACQGKLMFSNGYPAFNNPSGLCWLNLLNLYEVAGPVSFNTDDDLNRFLDGTIGVIFAGTWNLPEIQTALGEYLAIDPWPKYGESHLSGYVWTENVYFNGNLEGEDLDQSLGFARYLLSPEGQAVLTHTGRIPATLYRDVKDRITFQAVAALKDGTHYPVIPEMELYRSPMHRALLDIFYNDGIPTNVLKEAEEVILSLIGSAAVKEDDI
jgi:arabinogalactan oligomer/maltooligosaccharide transport system substrate-binding protein